MRPSNTVVSDLLRELQLASIDIDECLLIGEKVDMINEVGLIYNQLRELVTSEYFCDDEYKWITNMGHVWNAEVKQYRMEMGQTGEEVRKTNIEELEEQIRDVLTDLLGPRWGDSHGEEM